MAAARNGPEDDKAFRTEIYVDASQWGVGFVMDRSWLAWKFSDLLALSGNAPFDINWAEMLAVEVGLWTLIRLMKKEEECFDSVQVLVRCDNASVVKAIQKRHSSFQSQQEILRRIIDMVDEYDIELAVKWVPSSENLADNPSRGVSSLGMALLPFIPLLPSYLSDIFVSHRPKTARQRRRREGPLTALESPRPDPLEGFYDADNDVDSYCEVSDCW